MTKETGEVRGDASRQNRTEDSQDVGRRYRFKHLALRLVMRDMYSVEMIPARASRTGCAAPWRGYCTPLDYPCLGVTGHQQAVEDMDQPKSDTKAD